MRWPLRYQILIPFALVLLGAIVAVSALSALLATHRARTQIEEQLQGIAATLADSNFPLTNLVLRQMHGLSGADFVLTDAQGQEQAQSGGVESSDLPNPAATNNWRQLRLGAPRQIGSQRYFPMVLAMHGRGTQPPGKLHILYPEQFWQEARSEAAWPPLIVGGIALAATALLALMLAGRLTRPILELRSQVNRIAQADYSPIPLPERNDELRELAADVNHMAQRLADMESAVRRSERLTLLGQLAGGLAHNLRNNVTGALMAVQLHARKCDADHESLDVARRQLALTEENLKQFLAAPHGNPGFVAALKCVACKLTDVVQEVVDLVDPSLRHRRVHLSVVEHANNGKSTTGDLYADPNQLRQLLMNLVLNAADAAGPTGWVRIETELVSPRQLDRRDAEALREEFNQESNPSAIPDEQLHQACSSRHIDSASHDFQMSAPRLRDSAVNQIILRVIDNGPGPPPDIVKRLFEPFVTGKPEGVGLGLAVAQQIATSHGGSIVFHRAGGETCFEVHLPAKRHSSLVIGPLSLDQFEFGSQTTNDK